MNVKDDGSRWNKTFHNAKCSNEFENVFYFSFMRTLQQQIFAVYTIVEIRNFRDLKHFRMSLYRCARNSQE